VGWGISEEFERGCRLRVACGLGAAIAVRTHFRAERLNLVDAAAGRQPAK